MKLSLTVLAPSPSAGKRIPVTGTFLIGRDPQCQLRPASPLVSKRHCALSIRGNKVFVQDLGSTNGTFVNDRQIKGEIELRDQDRLQIAALAFAVSIEDDVPVPARPLVKAQTPAAPSKAGIEDSAADMLLSMPDETLAAQDSQEISSRSTVTELTVPPNPDEPPKTETKKPTELAKAAAANTSLAAKAILDKYLRRPRS